MLKLDTSSPALLAGTPITTTEEKTELKDTYVSGLPRQCMTFFLILCLIPAREGP